MACVHAYNPDCPDRMLSHMGPDEFNRLFPVGTKVRYWPFGPDARPESDTAITHEAWSTGAEVVCGIGSRKFPVQVYKLEMLK